MSWSTAPVKPVDFEHINEVIDAAMITGAQHEEHHEQFAAAKEAAKALIASGALGDGTDGRLFIVSLNGHANPGHQPTPGWANDMITVSVRSEPADSDAVRYVREGAERYEALNQRN